VDDPVPAPCTRALKLLPRRQASAALLAVPALLTGLVSACLPQQVQAGNHNAADHNAADHNAADPSGAAQALAEQLLQAIGGRATWAALRNTVNDSQQHRLAEPLEVRAVITMDFTRPRWRIDTTGPGLRLARVVNGERHWRLSRQGQVLPVSAATLDEDRRWYAGHLYRTLHRVARRDPLLRLALGSEGQLEAHEGMQRIAWWRLNAGGEPVAYGGPDEGAVTVCGPWREAAPGIAHPVWTARSDGSWRASLNRLQVNVSLADSLFEPPA
jgi:hypothetical protein